jgi:hypothetical protein
MATVRPLSARFFSVASSVAAVEERYFASPPRAKKKEVESDLTTSNNSHELRWQLDGGEAESRSVRVCGDETFTVGGDFTQKFASQMVFLGRNLRTEIPRLTYRVFRLKIIPRSTRKRRLSGARDSRWCSFRSRKKKKFARCSRSLTAFGVNNLREFIASTFCSSCAKK